MYSSFTANYKEVKGTMCILPSAQENIFTRKNQIAGEFIQLIALWTYFLTYSVILLMDKVFYHVDFSLGS